MIVKKADQKGQPSILKETLPGNVHSGLDGVYHSTENTS